MSIAFQILLVVILVIGNGIFAMSELAIVSARKSRLRHLAEEGDERARRALELAEHPNRFLSTVQIGITLIGIFAGAYGGATIARELTIYIARITPIAPYANEISLAIVVAMTTYLSLVIGELVPKRIALAHPERIARAVAGPMQVLSTIATPLEKLLTTSTDIVLRAFRLRPSEEPPITEEELSALIEQGAEAGVFEEEEQELVERVFWLGDQRVTALMVPRRNVIYLDLNDPLERNLAKTAEHKHSRFPVCEGGIDNVVGMVHVRDLWIAHVKNQPIDLRAIMRRPLFVPESMRALRLLEKFRAGGVQMALVVDEYGGVEGLITMDDIVEEITGEITVSAQPRIVQRDDGSWLVDASLTMDEFWDALGLEERREEERYEYNTVGGFVLSVLGHIPRESESFEALGFRWEVVDMDRHRVDKVLVSPLDREE